MNANAAVLPSHAPGDTIRDRRKPGFLACIAIGIGAAVVGLLPWFLTGLRLPLQNLWATASTSDAMPLVLLPFSQYAILLLTALVVTGAGVAGLVARLRSIRRARGVSAVTLGVLLVQVTATVQTTLVVQNGLEDSGRATLYLGVLIAVTVLSIAVGVLVLWLVALTPAPGATIGLSLAAIAAGMWVSSVVSPFGSLPGDITMTLLGFTRWIPAILIGAAIAWCGFRSAGRIAADVFSLLILWVAPAAITAVSAAAGTRVLASRPVEMAEYAGQVFGMALFLPEVVLPPLAVATAVGVAGNAVTRLWHRRRRARPEVPTAD